MASLSYDSSLGHIMTFNKPDNKIYNESGVDTMNREMEDEIRKCPKEYSWEYKKFRKLSQKPSDIYKDQRLQNAGVNKTSKVKISNRPKIMAKQRISFPRLETDVQLSETIPKPGPRLFKHAPTAENADSKSKPVPSMANSKNINIKT